MKILRKQRLLAAALPACWLIMVSFAFGSYDLNTGKNIYEKNCTPCHGADGARGRFGAKDLQKSLLADTDLKERITNGKRIMPAFAKRLTQDEITQVAAYIKTLRNNR